MEPLIKFRLFAVRLAMAGTLVAGIVAHPLFGRTASVGVLLGGLAGILVFWATARRLEKLASDENNSVYSVPLVWRSAGFLVYAAVLVRGYTLDREGFSGLIAVAAGLFIIRAALVVVGITGLDLPTEDE